MFTNLFFGCGWVFCGITMFALWPSLCKSLFTSFQSWTPSLLSPSLRTNLQRSSNLSFCTMCVFIWIACINAQNVRGIGVGAGGDSGRSRTSRLSSCNLPSAQRFLCEPVWETWSYSCSAWVVTVYVQPSLWVALTTSSFVSSIVGETEIAKTIWGQTMNACDMGWGNRGPVAQFIFIFHGAGISWYQSSARSRLGFAFDTSQPSCRVL